MLLNIAKAVLPEALVHRLRAMRRKVGSAGEMSRWSKLNYPAPSPGKIKRAVIVRNGLPNATWIETGTYHGDTTAVLSRVAIHVYSIEPEPTLARMAHGRFQSTDNVTIINDTSEAAMPGLLAKVCGDICLWLDGHFSAGGTFLGENAAPIKEELAEVEKNLARLGRVHVLVDDFRLFGSDPDYPLPSFLTGRAERNGLAWTVEHDIFIAMKRPVAPPSASANQALDS